MQCVIAGTGPSLDRVRDWGELPGFRIAVNCAGYVVPDCAYVAALDRVMWWEHMSMFEGKTLLTTQKAIDIAAIGRIEMPSERITVEPRHCVVKPGWRPRSGMVAVDYAVQHPEVDEVILVGVDGTDDDGYCEAVQPIMDDICARKMGSHQENGHRDTRKWMIDILEEAGMAWSIW